MKTAQFGGPSIQITYVQIQRDDFLLKIKKWLQFLSDIAEILPNHHESNFQSQFSD